MRAYSSMPLYEFTAQLRDIAIKAGAKPLVMDMIDALGTVPTPEDIEQDQVEAIEAAENDARAEMWNTCFDAVAEAIDDVDCPEEFTDAQREYIKALLIEVQP